MATRIDPFDINVMLNPAKYGLEECEHCNGYGSSLKEESPRCSKCGGSGLIAKLAVAE